MEIYNESVNDLLRENNQNLELRESRDGKLLVQDLTCMRVNNAAELINLQLKGDEIRMVAETKFNTQSSRSHTVFRINILLEDKNMQTMRSVNKTSEINFVDLAGSEGASKCKSIGLRLREGGNINKSLLALSNVIYKLSQQVSAKQKYYINFRDSKLTRILQNSLLGES
jgi:centromeric protein E